MARRTRDIFHSSSSPLLLLCNRRLYCSVVVVSYLEISNIHQLLYSLLWLRYPQNRLHILCSGTYILKIQNERSSLLDKGSMGMNRCSPTCMYFQGTADKWIPVTCILVSRGIGIMMCMSGVHLPSGNRLWYLNHRCMMTGHCYCRLRYRV